MTKRWGALLGALLVAVALPVGTAVAKTTTEPGAYLSAGEMPDDIACSPDSAAVGYCGSSNPAVTQPNLTASGATLGVPGAAAPEPMSLLLVAAGLVGIAAARRLSR